MKANYMNYFKAGKLYQWDKSKSIFTITNTDIQDEFCLDQKGMSLFLSFKNPEITLGNTLVVKSGKMKANIKLVDEKLLLPSNEYTSDFTVNIEKLKTANNFVAKNDKRIVLTGVNINKNYIASTDNFSMYKTECVSDCNITIASEFIKELPNQKGDITFKVNANSISCTIEDVTYIGRLIAGKYPDVSRIYTYEGNIINLNKSTFDILKYSNDKSDCLHIERNKLTLNGENDIEIEIDLDMDVDIWFNCEKLENAIKNVSSENLEIFYNGTLKPIIINKEIMVLPVKRGA